MGKSQLGIDIRRERDRYGSYFEGLKLRSSNDDSAPMITGNTEVKSTIIADAKPKTSSTNVVNKLWTMAITQVLEAIDRMINKNVDVDEIAEDNTEKKEPPEEFIEPSSSDNQIVLNPKITKAPCSVERKGAFATSSSRQTIFGTDVLVWNDRKIFRFPFISYQSLSRQYKKLV